MGDGYKLTFPDDGKHPLEDMKARAATEQQGRVHHGGRRLVDDLADLGARARFVLLVSGLLAGGAVLAGYLFGLGERLAGVR